MGYCQKVLQFLKGGRDKFFQECTVFPHTIAETSPCINYKLRNLALVNLLVYTLNLTAIDSDITFYNHINKLYEELRYMRKYPFYLAF